MGKERSTIIIQEALTRCFLERKGLIQISGVRLKNVREKWVLDSICGSGEEVKIKIIEQLSIKLNE